MSVPKKFDGSDDSVETFPRSFGRYVLTERIGAGGMAEIFRAMTVGTEGFRRVLVVKRIRKSLDASSEFLRMFFDEAKISALLNHPFIVQIYDFGQIDGAYFLAMEHVDGRDLGNVLRRLHKLGKQLHPSTAALIAQQVAQGLHYAHTLQSADGQPFNIVHRDVNPSNVMLLRTGIVKILDFGIAKASAAAGKAQTRATVIKGKLGYLSPEQARCEVLDGRSDVFSLGATLWEMLTGEKLFSGATDFERIRNVLEAPISSPTKHRAGVPAALERIVMRALDRDLRRRYGNAEEMAEELEEFLRRSPAESQAIKKLIGHLYDGDDVRNTTTLTAIAPTAITVAGAASRPGSDHAATPASPAPRAGVIARAREKRPGALAWGIGASLLVAAAAVVLSVVRASPGLHADEASAASPGAHDVRIEVNSEPSGAAVSGSRGRLGATPLVVTLPASSEVELLRFEKPGFAPEVYELHPKSGGFVFVELRKAGDDNPASAQDRL
ncbi:MAG TPA: serine/threonine-protein kinase [Polyangia bacterium]|jgi:serine/threonine protein kinase|nr:serine/threonine-protein kinase [Polyangia bacterium]